MIQTREPGFPAGSTFKRDAWDVGAENEVQVSWSVTPSEFYVQLLSTHSSFRAMMQAIPQEYRKREKAEPSSLNVGDCVIARSDEDRALYRAQIKESSFGSKSLIDTYLIAVLLVIQICYFNLT